MRAGQYARRHPRGGRRSTGNCDSFNESRELIPGYGREATPQHMARMEFVQ